MKCSYTFNIGKHIQHNKSNNIPDQKRNINPLESLISTSVASIFILFEMLSDGIALPIEYKNGDHPHVILRIASITSLFVSKVSLTYKGKYDISSQTLIERALEICKPVLQKSDSLEKFIKAISIDQEFLVEYITEMLSYRDKRDWMAGCQLKKLNK